MDKTSQDMIKNLLKKYDTQHGDELISELNKYKYYRGIVNIPIFSGAVIYEALYAINPQPFARIVMFLNLAGQSCDARDIIKQVYKLRKFKYSMR